MTSVEWRIPWMAVFGRMNLYNPAEVLTEVLGHLALKFLLWTASSERL